MKNKLFTVLLVASALLANTNLKSMETEGIKISAKEKIQGREETLKYIKGCEEEDCPVSFTSRAGISSRRLLTSFIGEDVRDGVFDFLDNAEDITLNYTAFASGELLSDLEILDELISEFQNRWKKKKIILNIALIDLIYEKSEKHKCAQELSNWLNSTDRVTANITLYKSLGDYIDACEKDSGLKCNMFTYIDAIMFSPKPKPSATRTILKDGAQDQCAFYELHKFSCEKAASVVGYKHPTIFKGMYRKGDAEFSIKTYALDNEGEKLKGFMDMRFKPKGFSFMSWQ